MTISIKRTNQILALLFFFSAGCLAQENSESLPDCEWCGTSEAPSDISSETTIPSLNEPGEALIINGIIYKQDKKTPASDVILYVYHTNSKGIYPKNGDEKGNGKRHGYLRSWIKTGRDGKFKLNTIRPGSYPDSRAPAHIHMTIQAPGEKEYSADIVLFEDDPFLSDDHRKNADVLNPVKDNSGVWSAEQIIILR